MLLDLVHVYRVQMAALCLTPTAERGAFFFVSLGTQFPKMRWYYALLLCPVKMLLQLVSAMDLLWQKVARFMLLLLTVGRLTLLSSRSLVCLAKLGSLSVLLIVLVLLSGPPWQMALVLGLIEFLVHLTCSA